MSSSKTIKSHPDAALQLSDALWAESNFDLQLLAARLLGQLPVVPPAPVIDRLQSWVRSDPDRHLLDGIVGVWSPASSAGSS